MIKSVIEIIIELVGALGLTVLIEWGLSCLFLHSKFDRRLVVLVQCLTNPALNVLLLINYYFGDLHQVFLIVALEFLVVIIEAIIYQKGIRDAKINPFGLSLFLNLASLGAGLLLSFWLFSVS